MKQKKADKTLAELVKNKSQGQWSGSVPETTDSSKKNKEDTETFRKNRAIDPDK